MLKFIGGIILISLMMGCSTTRGPSTVNQLQIRVAKLERKINERDAVIFELQNDIKAITSQMENAEEHKKVDLQVMAGEPLDIPVEPSQDKGVIRIEMSSQHIQTALNAAGYYDGPIDGNS